MRRFDAAKLKYNAGGFGVERENIDLKDYWPLVVKRILEFEKIADAENPEINNLWAAHKDVLDNQFIRTLTEEGCKRWEDILNIVPMGTDTLEDRRFRILARINADLPFTFRQLENMLYALCGDDYTCELVNNDYKLVVRLALGVRRQYDEVSSLLKKVVPANLLIDLDLLWNQYLLLEPFIHEDLEPYTHEELREENLTTSIRNKYSNFTTLTYQELASHNHRELRKEEING